MPLFNKRVVEDAAKAVGEIPEAHRDTLSKWSELVRSGHIRGFKETALDGDFKAEIMQGVLGYRPAGDPDGQTIAKEYAVSGGSVDLALGIFKDTPTIVAPFELKGATQLDLDSPVAGRRESPVEQAWRYARQVGRSVKWVMVSNMMEIRLYSYREGEREYERFEIARLVEPDEYARFVTILGADAFLGGDTERLLEASLAADKALSDAFYAEYQALRQDLIHDIAAQTDAEGDPFDPEHVVSLAQTVMDRILFIAFAEDRGLLPAKSLEHAQTARNDFNPQPVWQNYLGLFRQIDEGGRIKGEPVPAYNGGLFRRDPEIRDLHFSDDLCDGFRQIGAYDFKDEVDVVVLGYIFEQSLRDLETHLAYARGEEQGDFRSLGKGVDKIKRDGVVYTPGFVARFITDRTLGTHVRELYADTMREFAKSGDPEDYESLKWAKKSDQLSAWRAYLERLQGVRVVDPACGSGIFLVTAYDWLKSEYRRTADKLAELRGDAGTFDLFDFDSTILTRNLYGVDVNAESVELTKLSLWLKTANRDKPLDDLEAHIRVGDSLIEDSNYAYLEHGFTWASAFPEVFADGGFDVVLGNPPYVRMELIKAMKPYLATRYAVVSDRADLYSYFYERGLRLLKPGGRLGYISNNTFFKTGSGKPLREYLAKEATLEIAADFGDTQIFEGVTTYPVIMVMRRGAPDADHMLRFWNIPALPTGEFGAAFGAMSETYPQAELGSGSWELESRALRELREKIRGDHPTLEEVYGAPLYGIKTGLNAAFVIDRATRDRLVAEDARSEELIVSLVEGNQISRWTLAYQDTHLIYIPKGKVRIQDYPAIRDHLAPFREFKKGKQLRGLDHRATDQRWFELQQAQEAYVPHMEGTKIAYSRFAGSCNFAMLAEGQYLTDAPYFIPTSDYALLSYLNSKVAWYCLASSATDLRGGYVQLLGRYVGPLPIPKSLPEDDRLSNLGITCTTLAADRLALQTAVTRRIPDLCPAERREADGSVKLGRKLEAWWEHDFATFRAEVKKRFKRDIPLAERSDWEDMMDENRREIARLSTEIAEAERRIDARVYEMFGLTDAEIALLEGAI